MDDRLRSTVMILFDDLTDAARLEFIHSKEGKELLGDVEALEEKLIEGLPKEKLEIFEEYTQARNLYHALMEDFVYKSGIIDVIRLIKFYWRLAR